MYKKREPNTTNLLQKTDTLKKGNNVLELGANIGYYALLEWQKIKPTGTIYAVEPVTENYNNLIENINLNRPNDIKPYKLAFGQKTEKSTIYLSQKLNWCTLNKRGIQEQTGQETVQVTTVDKFLKDKKQINLIRMDVEGYEYEVLKGSTRILTENTKILMEVHPTIISNLKEFYEILQQNNYKVEYAIFEYKVQYNYALYSLFKKYAGGLPKIYYNITIKKLKTLLQNTSICPNILFTK